MIIDRRKRGTFNDWWWTVDQFTLYIVAIIMAISAVMVATASPAVADRIGLEPFYFVRRQLIYLIMALSVVISISMLSQQNIRRLSFIGFFIGVILMILVLVYGMEAKGAKRWINILGFSMQPSEFIKPFFAIVTAWILSRKAEIANFPSLKISIGLYLFLVALLALQPDFGMIIMISAVWSGQLFLAGLSMLWIIAVSIFGIAGLISAYFIFPHVANRINSFLDPTNTENYQVKKSIEAFINGGVYGKGPAEGTVKQVLPDSHTDFIFAVIGEELGMIACILIISLFAFIVIRGLVRVIHEDNLFVTYSVAGLIMQFGLQSMINIGVTLNLLPTKGMTLPFISYGGSSMLAVSIAMGMLLALTRRRYGVISSKALEDIYLYSK